MIFVITKLTVGNKRSINEAITNAFRCLRLSVKDHEVSVFDVKQHVHLNGAEINSTLLPALKYHDLIKIVTEIMFF